MFTVQQCFRSIYSPIHIQVLKDKKEIEVDQAQDLEDQVYQQSDHFAQDAKYHEIATY